MNQNHPCGNEAYDQSYGLGYQVNHGELSPYPRINRLRKRFLSTEFTIDSKRAVLVTEAYQANEIEPVPKKCALALKNVLENVPIDLYDDELLVGEIAAPMKAAPIYPEFSVDWILDELLHHPFSERPHDAFQISEGDRAALLRVLPYWKGKTVADLAEQELSDTQRLGSELGKKVYMTNLYHYGGIGHLCPDFKRLLQTGHGSLIREAKEMLSSLSPKDPEYEEKKVWYESVIIELESAVTFIKRYAALAEEKAKDEDDPGRKNELAYIASNCMEIAEGPAKTFWQALQLWHFATTITEIESNGHSVSFGRMDQWLYPYYQNDVAHHILTKDFAGELLECAFIKMGNPSKLKDRMTVQVRNGRGWGGESLTIGGTKTDGSDATNDLTFLILEASVHTRLMTPWVCVRMHEHTPYELKVKTFECIRAGYGHPKLYNDATAIRVMQKKGMTIEEARDYAVVGCVEPDLPGKEYGFHDAAYMNLVRVLELSLNHGICYECSEECPQYQQCRHSGRTLGPDTGGLDTFSSMDEVLGSFHLQLSYWTDAMCDMVNLIDLAHRKRKPLPYLSSLIENCISSGKDINSGGAKYNFSGPQGCGIATCADALTAIHQLIFDEKRITGEKLLDAVKNDWAGFEMLYALINSERVHHFGNDDDYADRFYREVFELYCKCFSGKKNPRGGTFCPGVYSVNANVGMGLTLSASPDGRKKGEPISDNMGPVHTAASSHDRLGPTAIANSVNKVDHALATNGTLLNWKFPPECVSGIQGRENLISFVDTFFHGSATHCQFNILSSKTMRRAMEHPEEYRDLLVRVAGYSAYFVELGKPLQMDLINRTELSFS